MFACTGDMESVNSSETRESDVEELHDPNSVDKVESPDRSKYIDEEIASNVILEYGPVNENVNAVIENESFPVQFYEGTLMKALGAAAGFSLRFTPYDFWDDDLEMEVKSDFDYTIDVNLSREQNTVLEFVDYTDETENLAWDYFENLFQIYYYEKEGNNFPLKFVNLGKTDWDG